jgi:hypothetical protein
MNARNEREGITFFPRSINAAKESAIRRKKFAELRGCFWAPLPQLASKKN